VTFLFPGWVLIVSVALLLIAPSADDALQWAMTNARAYATPE
jgi:hypothetical protein